MIVGLVARARSLWRGLRRRASIESEMDAEFRAHIDMRADDLVRSGLARDDALRQARREFGLPERYKDEARASRGLRRFDALRMSSLDFTLGFRMLFRYPGLTIIGGIAVAFAIAVGAGAFELISQISHPHVPLADGDRIVALRLWNTEANQVEPRAAFDLGVWRNELKSVQNLGAYITRRQNLAPENGVGSPVVVAEINANAFTLAGVQPELGRPLVTADEAPGAPSVIVLGHEIWISRFAGDSGIIGRSVRVGKMLTTVVGVMPAGFAFPVNHEVWIPLHAEALAFGPRQGPGIGTFARLMPHVSRGEAQAELSVVGKRMSSDFRESHEHIRPELGPFARPFAAIDNLAGGELLLVNIFFVMLLVLVCGNVALLMFARAAARERDVVVRTALGATRSRIVVQHLAEALVLCGVGAVAGLGSTGWLLKWARGAFEADMTNGRGGLPFWYTPSLSWPTIVYATALTLMAALIAGVIPALKVTAGRMESRLRESSAGGGGLRFGGIWTALIVTQVAVTVAFPAIAFFLQGDKTHAQSVDAGIPEKEFLTFAVEMDADGPGDFRARYRAEYDELFSRLNAEPSVAGVTYATRFPRMSHNSIRIDVSEGGIAPNAWCRRTGTWTCERGPIDAARGHNVASELIDPAYFDVLGVRLTSGRMFRDTDLEPGHRVAIVNQSLVNQVFGGADPVGRRVRYVEGSRWGMDPGTPGEPGPWYDIIGVVRDLGMRTGFGEAGLYHPTLPERIYPALLAVHVRGDANAFIPKLSAIATAIDPGLRLVQVMTIDKLLDAEFTFINFFLALVALVSAVALLLSLAAIYAVMAFTVARRTREIGIRVALGSGRRSVIMTIFSRPLLQIAFGVLGGALIVLALSTGAIGLRIEQVGAVAAYAVAMMAVCMIACIVPTRRALRIQPTEALKSSD